MSCSLLFRYRCSEFLWVAPAVNRARTGYVEGVGVRFQGDNKGEIAASGLMQRRSTGVSDASVAPLGND